MAISAFGPWNLQSVVKNIRKCYQAKTARTLYCRYEMRTRKERFSIHTGPSVAGLWLAFHRCIASSLLRRSMNRHQLLQQRLQQLQIQRVRSVGHGICGVVVHLKKQPVDSRRHRRSG